MVVYTRKVYRFNSSCFPYHFIVSYEPRHDFRNENIIYMEYLRDLHRGKTIVGGITLLHMKIMTLSLRYCGDNEP